MLMFMMLMMFLLLLLSLSLLMLQTDMDSGASHQLIHTSLDFLGKPGYVQFLQGRSDGAPVWSSAVSGQSRWSDAFVIWFSEALLPLQVWIQHVFSNDFSDFSLSLPLSLFLIAFIHSIFLRFNPARLAILFQRKTPPPSVSVPRCAWGSGEAMWMGNDKWSTYCEHFWANWNFTLMPDRYCMETMKDTLSEEKMETLKSMNHTFWAEVTLAALASQSRTVHRSIVGRCGFEALGWLWQDQVVLRFYLLQGGWWWCNRWQHVKHRFCAQNPGGLHRDVFVSSLGTHLERSFPLKDTVYLLYIHRTYDIYDIYFPLTCSASPECAKMMFFLKQAEFVISGNRQGNFRKTEGSGPSAIFLSVLRPWVEFMFIFHYRFDSPAYFKVTCPLEMPHPPAWDCPIGKDPRVWSRDLWKREAVGTDLRWLWQLWEWLRILTPWSLTLEFSHGFCTMFTQRFDCRNNCHGWHPSFEWHGTGQNSVLEFGIKNILVPLKKRRENGKNFFRAVLYLPYI